MPFKHSRVAHLSVGAIVKLAQLHRVRFALVVLLLLTMIVGGLEGFPFLSSHFMGAAHAAPEGGPVKFPGTITPLLVRSRQIGPADATRSISLSIGLRPRNQDMLMSYAQEINRKGSANYHRYLSPAQFADVYGPNEADYNALKQFLHASGFTITRTYGHRLLVAFQGTIGRAEQVFHVAINNYIAPGGRVYYANTNDPVFPASLAGKIQNMSGLNTALFWQHPPLLKHTAQLHSNTFANNCPTHGTGYFTPDQTAAAYDLNGLYQAKYRGEGQTIALFELNTFSLHDLQTYEACYGQSHAAIQTIVTGVSPVPTDNGVVEVELDAELVLSAAPRLGMLKIYEAANDRADYNAEWAQIIQDAPPVVSTSWGLCELDVTQLEAQQENVYFAAAAVQGQTILAASGNSGSAGCAMDQPPMNGLVVGDPASQPYVTGVGGTTLTLSNGSYGQETTWNDVPNLATQDVGGASGGGISSFWVSPGWQNGPGVQNSFSSGAPCGASGGAICREVPDVSLNADPNTGYLIFCSVALAGCDSRGGWYSIGGTSAAAPMWAALMAIVNQMAARQGIANIGFANPLLYQAAGAPEASSLLHDVTVGTNDYNNLNNGRYPAGKGYDMATGLGSYDAYHLAGKLVNLMASNNPSLLSASAPNWYFAEGSVGGGFQEYLTLYNPNVLTSSRVQITYLFQSGIPVTVIYTINAGTRLTVNVNNDVHVRVSDRQVALSAIVQTTNGVNIVAERPMYFNFKGIQSGTDTMGAVQTATSYYFAEGDTTNLLKTYYTYVTILNPSATQTATTTVTYYTGSCGQSGQPTCPTQVAIVPPLRRGTVTPLSIPLLRQMAIKVVSNQPVVVERPLYFRDNIPTAGGMTTGASTEVGAMAPGQNWLFAEGYTGKNFQETFVLANFATTATTAHVKLEYNNGHAQSYDVVVPALGQTYFDVNKANANPTGTCDVTPCQVSNTLSAEITSSAPIVAERMMFFHYANSISGLTDVLGSTSNVLDFYTFAEGYISSTFQEYLAIQSLGSSYTTIIVTFYVDTYIFDQAFTMPAHTRLTLNVNSMIATMLYSYPNLGPESFAVSLSVQSQNFPIVVERPIYFNYHGDMGGSDVVGLGGSIAG